jgi:hypothetical protein
MVRARGSEGACGMSHAEAVVQTDGGVDIASVAASSRTQRLRQQVDVPPVSKCVGEDIATCTARRAETGTMNPSRSCCSNSAGVDRRFGRREQS